MLINQSKKFSQFFEIPKKPRQIDFLVLHHVQANSAIHAVEQFKQHQVSAHFLIDELGEIFQLVDENHVAYHAGISFWSGVEGLNISSIGVEFVNSQPFENKFKNSQMVVGVELCQYLVEKYQIKARNIVGHSDIAYDKDSGCLNRKQDPSHLFDWRFLAENGVGIFPQVLAPKTKLFELGNREIKIAQIKKNLQNFGYRTINLNDEFDLEMQALVLVFNRRFLGENLDFWTKKSQAVLDCLCKQICEADKAQS